MAAVSQNPTIIVLGLITLPDVYEEQVGPDIPHSRRGLPLMAAIIITG